MNSQILMVVLLVAAVLLVWLLADLHRVYRKLSAVQPEEDQALEFWSLFPILRKISGRLNWFLNELQNRFAERRQFTENASHELQTPLAVIQANAELLAQSPHLTESDFEATDAILNAAGRLSRINSSLILLSKIEHGQILRESRFNLISVISSQIDDYQAKLDFRGIDVHEEYDQSLLLRTDHDLMDILLSNLIRNAVQHNLPGGWIRFQLSGNQLSIQNTGPELTKPPESMFERFSRNENSQNSTGLGLAIVNRIAEIMGLEVSYHYSKKPVVHSLTVKFPAEMISHRISPES